MKNKVPKKLVYVTNEYTGRSKMMHGGKHKKKKERREIDEIRMLT